MQDSQWGLTRVEQRGRIPSLALLATFLLMRPRIWLAFWATSTHWWLISSFSSTVSPSPSHQVCSQSLHPHACIDTWGCPNLGLGPCIWPCLTSWGSHRPTSPACPGLFGWYPVLLVCELHHSAWCHLQTCWGCSQSYHVIDEDIKQYWIQYGPLRDTTCHWSPFGHWAIDHYPLDVTIQPIPYPPNSPHIKSISPQFKEKVIVEDCVKRLIEVQTDATCCFSFVQWCSHSITDSH